MKIICALCITELEKITIVLFKTSRNTDLLLKFLTLAQSAEHLYINGSSSDLSCYPPDSHHSSICLLENSIQKIWKKSRPTVT